MNCFKSRLNNWWKHHPSKFDPACYIPGQTTRVYTNYPNASGRGRDTWYLTYTTVRTLRIKILSWNDPGQNDPRPKRLMSETTHGRNLRDIPLQLQSGLFRFVCSEQAHRGSFLRALRLLSTRKNRLRPLRWHDLFVSSVRFHRHLGSVEKTSPPPQPSSPINFCILSFKIWYFVCLKLYRC